MRFLLVSPAFNVAYGYIGLVCCKGNGRYVSPHISSLETMLTWLHLCVVIDLSEGDIILYVNDVVQRGKIKILNKDTQQTLPDGRLVLGQEQDVVLGGFTLFQSFEGVFAGYTLVSSLLIEDVIKTFLRCGETQFSNILASFDTLDREWTKVGAVRIRQIPVSRICRKNNYFSVVFPEQRSFTEAFTLCRVLKGEVVVPMNEEENLRFVRATQNYTKVCASEYGIYMWIGIEAKETERSITMYSNHRNLPIRYSNFRPGFSNLFGEYKCVFMDKHMIGMWAVYPCDLLSCVTCGFNNTIRFNLRGLCKNSFIDNIYYIDGYYDGKPKFEGISQSKIVWNNSTWVILNSMHDETIATMEFTKKDQYPIGLHKWDVKGDICQDETPLLLLTTCNSFQYTCNDGTCIPKIQRCDLEIQCPDRSDEVLCSPVVVPTEYIKEVPPPKLGTEPATVSLFVTIITVYPVKILESRAIIEMLVTLQWRDERLYMESLNYAEDMNLISNGEKIWVPSFVIEDNTGSDTDSRLNWQNFVVVMESGPEPDDKTRVKEDEVYSGSQNYLKITQAYSVNFFCKMNLASYPFDTQQCSIIIRLKDVGKNFVVLQTKDKGIMYNGSRYLREYEVISCSINKYENLGNFSAYKVTISLDNLSGFYVFSTYVPTFLMVIICYLTFYFHIQDFNDRIMVSLTALLVLATLFTQITETTPTTAYLKLLDVWFVSCIFINFLIVVNLVVINHIRIRDEEEEEKPKFTPVLSYKARNPSPRRKTSRAESLNKKATIYVPIFVIIFAASYIGISLTFVF